MSSPQMPIGPRLQPRALYRYRYKENLQINTSSIFSPHYLIGSFLGWVGMSRVIASRRSDWHWRIVAISRWSPLHISLKHAFSNPIVLSGQAIGNLCEIRPRTFSLNSQRRSRADCLDVAQGSRSRPEWLVPVCPQHHPLCTAHRGNTHTHKHRGNTHTHTHTQTQRIHTNTNTDVNLKIQMEKTQTPMQMYSHTGKHNK